MGQHDIAGFRERIAAEGKATINSPAMRALLSEMGVEALKQAPVVGGLSKPV
ncbi:hypothetical protein ACP3TG_29075 [Phytobacter diazotrophicus]